MQNLNKEHLSCNICFEEFSAKENILKISEEEKREMEDLAAKKRKKNERRTKRKRNE